MYLNASSQLVLHAPAFDGISHLSEQHCPQLLKPAKAGARNVRELMGATDFQRGRQCSQ